MKQVSIEKRAYQIMRESFGTTRAEARFLAKLERGLNNLKQPVIALEGK